MKDICKFSLLIHEDDRDGIKRPIKISHFMQRYPASVLRSKDFNQNIKDMKTKNTFATYESPQTTLMTFTAEGVLCASTQEFGWNPDNNLDFSNDFSDWNK